MERNTLFAAGMVSVVVVALVAAAVAPGVIADPIDDGFVRPGPVDVAGVSIAAGQATGETVTLEIETRTDHRDNPTQNVNVLVRTVDAESGLLTTTQELDVGTLSKDGETATTTNLTVPREGGYNAEIVLYSDDKRVDEARESVRGVSAVKPPYLQLTTSFTNSEALPPVSFAIAETGEDRTTLDLAATLTNAGDDPTGDLSVLFVLRQAESNIVASRMMTDAGTIETGRTETVDASASVPNNYNYYIDVVLLHDGVVIGTARGAANLSPTRTISVNQTREDMELRVEDFENDDGGDAPRETTYEPTETTSSAPGFSPLVAVVRLLAAVLVARRWSK